ncbi:MAG: myo-inositol-1-phosphate synthase, partial [Desulfurococcales archaeon]|nr:myo-inositol-1-phosphate synthase [Desulfurococcales archaeon]
VGLERIKKGAVEKYGIPLAKYDLPYRVEDIEIVAAYDVDEAKVGKTLYDLGKEIFGEDYDVPETLKKVEVRRGLHLNSTEGLPFNAKGIEDLKGIEEGIEEIVSEWMDLKPDVIVNVITTEKGDTYTTKDEALQAILSGRAPATHAYAYATAEYVRRSGKKAAFVNAIPTPVANNPGLLKLFEESGAIVFGDDGATGATPLTSDLLEHMAERNRHVLFVVQFNIGGNTDFLALTQPERNKMKETTKSSMVEDILGYDAPHYIKPTGYLESLGDKKYVAMHMELLSLNGFRDSLFVSARINDSPALAGMLVDLIRLGKIAADKGLSGTVYEVNTFFMKKPGPLGSKNIAKSHAYKELLRWLGLA